MRATNAIGDGAYSSTIRIIAAAVPDPPINLAKISSTKTSVEFGWDPDANGGSPIRDYVVYWDAGDDTLAEADFVNIATTTFLTQEHEQLELTADTTYRFTVSARNDAGVGNPSSVISLLAAEKPGTPDPPFVSLQNQSTIEVTWVAPDDNGGTALTGYEVHWDQGIDTFVQLGSTDADTLSFVKSTGLSTGDPYKFKVLAINSIDKGDLSAESVPILAAKVPERPTDLAVVSSSSTQITFDWVVPDDGGSPITHYRVFWD